MEASGCAGSMSADAISFGRGIANRSRLPSKATVCAPVSRKVCLRGVQPTRAFVFATTGHCSAAIRKLCDSKPVIGASCPSAYRASDRACAATRKRDVHCHATRSMSESLEEVKSTRTDSIKLISLSRKVRYCADGTARPNRYPLSERGRTATSQDSTASSPICFDSAVCCSVYMEHLQHTSFVVYPLQSGLDAMLHVCSGLLIQIPGKRRCCSS